MCFAVRFLWLPVMLEQSSVIPSYVSNLIKLKLVLNRAWDAFMSPESVWYHFRVDEQMVAIESVARFTRHSGHK